MMANSWKRYEYLNSMKRREQKSTRAIDKNEQEKEREREIDGGRGLSVCGNVEEKVAKFNINKR